MGNAEGKDIILDHESGGEKSTQRAQTFMLIGADIDINELTITTDRDTVVQYMQQDD